MAGVRELRAPPWRGTHLRAEIAAFAAGLLVASAAIAVIGVRAGGDTPRYTRAAERILQGELPQENKARSSARWPEAAP